MSPNAPETSQNNEDRAQTGQDDLVRQVAERVWELWQEELRLERERRGGARR